MATKKKNNAIEEFFKSYSATDEILDFKFGHEVFSDTHDVISTSSLALDDALSAGGLPKGRLIQFYGASASGKTLVSMLSIKEAQKQDKKALQIFIDAEQTFNTSWAKQLGINLSRVGIISGDTAQYGQKLFELLLGVPKEDAKHKFAGKSKEGLLDKIANGEMNVNMIVLDSLGSIIVPGLDTATVGQVTIGKGARFFTDTFPKLALEVSKAKVPMIIINHVKAGLSMWGPDHTFSGGNSYTHHLSANVYFEMVNRKDSIILDERENKIGGLIRATVEKSKFGPHPRKCEFKVNFYKGVIDIHEEIAELALSYDIIKQTNKTYEYGDQKWIGRNNVLEAVAGNEILASELKEKIESSRKERRVKQLEEQEILRDEVLEEIEIPSVEEATEE